MKNVLIAKRPSLTPELWTRSHYIWAKQQCAAEETGRWMQWNDPIPRSPRGTIRRTEDGAREPVGPAGRELAVNLMTGGWDLWTPRFLVEAVAADVRRCGDAGVRRMLMHLSVR
jgi:hypothetical protein